MVKPLAFLDVDFVDDCRAGLSAAEGGAGTIAKNQKIGVRDQSDPTPCTTGHCADRKQTIRRSFAPLHHIHRSIMMNVYYTKPKIKLALTMVICDTVWTN